MPVVLSVTSNKGMPSADNDAISVLSIGRDDGFDSGDSFSSGGAPKIIGVAGLGTSNASSICSVSSVNEKRNEVSPPRTTVLLFQIFPCCTRF